MRKYRFLPFLFLVYGSILGAGKEDFSKGIDCEVAFQYGDRIGERYLSVAIFSHGKKVRDFHSEVQSGGAFERDDPPRLSPTGQFFLLSQIESGNIELPDGSVKLHEVAYCNLVEVRSGCIVMRETGQFCGGTFTIEGKWSGQLAPDVDLVDEIPKVSDYSSGRRKPAKSLDTSFYNLLACDSPDSENIGLYRRLIDKGVFDVDGFEREVLRRALEESYLESSFDEVE